jgi:hypothetical protein
MTISSPASQPLRDRLAPFSSDAARAQWLDSHPADKNPQIVDFIWCYLQQTPDLLDLTAACIALINTAPKTYPPLAEVLQLAPAFIARSTATAESDLFDLLDAAYFCNRLIEELNDHLHTHCGQPLLELDISIANVMIHGLLGDDYANQLDLAIFYALESLLGDNSQDWSSLCTSLNQTKNSAPWRAMLAESPVLASAQQVARHPALALLGLSLDATTNPA